MSNTATVVVVVVVVLGGEGIVVFVAVFVVALEFRGS